MAKDDPKTYLAANVLNESKLVSYRMLSRDLKVHSNLAKQMLYQFYTQQNARKPASVHATYLLCGYIRYQEVDTGKTEVSDSFLQSSPYMSSPAGHDENEPKEDRMQMVITLVKEEDLEQAKAKYDRLTAIHIYSLGPTSIQNIQLLTECGRQISVHHANEDPLIHNKEYGIIQNPRVRRRKGRRPPPAPAVVEPKAVAAAAAAAAKKSAATEPAPVAATKRDSTSSRPTTPAIGDSRPTSSTKGPDKKPTLKKENSDIFKAFAKKPPAKLKAEGTGSSTASAAVKPQYDVEMKDAESSSGEDDFVPPPPKQSSAAPSKASRTEREEKLRQMMDEEDGDDDDDGDDDETDKADETNEDYEMVDAPSPSNPIDAPQTSKRKSPSPPPPAPEVSHGRRRGRRKVMKKRTMKDAEGYLVTKEEPVWESFSEEDRPPPAQKPKVQVGGIKGKATSSAKGQGNLMSFFGKGPKK